MNAEHELMKNFWYWSRPSLEGRVWSTTYCILQVW